MSLELLADYCQELGTVLFEDPKGRGWLIYVMQPPHCRIRECYVVPSERRKGVGLGMCLLVGEMARERGCTHLLSSVNIRNPGAMNSIAAHIGGGAVCTDAQQGVLTFEYTL
jgi:hypothetical protein